MKNYLIVVYFLVFGVGCKAQVRDYSGLKYVGFVYTGTLNKSFVNKQLRFVKGRDTIIINLKLPFDRKTSNIYDQGIFYNCSLRQDTIYSFVLAPATTDSIPKEYNSYYRLNTKFNSLNHFTEIRNNTSYQYKGSYGMYVDIENRLYLIRNMIPAGDCVMQH